jgi:hypothetical protein
MTQRDVDMRSDTRGSSTPEWTEAETRRRPETKTFLASSEFWVMAGAVIALFVGGYVLDDIADGIAWKYATWVAIAYIVSRGLAKAGSQRNYDTVGRERR